MKTNLKIALLCALTLGFAQGAWADFTVNSAADTGDPDQGDGICGIPPIGMGDSICTLRAAIAESNASPEADTIDFDIEGTITLSTSLPAIITPINITGPGAATVTVDCNAQATPVRAFNITNTALAVSYTISGLTLTNCSTDTAAGGGAIAFTEAGAGSTLNVADMVFDSNTASDGTGGALSLGDGLIANVSDSTFTANVATNGGGAIYSNGDLTVTGSSFNSNASGEGDVGGGAIASVLNTTGQLSVATSDFIDNIAGTPGDGVTEASITEDGGAIYISEVLSARNSLITTSTLSSNEADNGGGIAVGRGSGEVTRSTLVGNTASSAGGAIFLGLDGGNGSINLRNSTLSANTAANGGGIGAATNNSGSSTMVNTTLAMNTGAGIDVGNTPAVIFAADANSQFIKNLLVDNTPDNCAAPFNHAGDEVNGGSNVSSDDSCGLTQSTDIEDATANLDALGDYAGPTETHRLLVGSDAIDAGSATIGETADQRGAPSADGDENPPTVRDAGAYEFAGFSAVEFSAGMFSEAENETLAMLLARRYGDLSTAVTATIESDGSGTATINTDYDAVNEMVTWAAADGTSKTVEVTLNDDTEVEGDETAGFEVTAVPTGVDLGNNNPTVLTITDVEEGEYNLQDTDLSVTEGTDATVSIVITRTGGADGASEVRLFTTDGGTDPADATAGEDYDMTDVVVPFADGETSQTVEIAITDDDLFELNDESFTVTIELTDNSGQARLGTDTTGNVSITSDDAAETGTFSFTETAATVTEGDGTVTFDVQRTDGDNCPVVVSYTVNDGTADAGDDFDDAGDGTLSFADGDSANKTITINLTDDAENESTEDFSITLSAADPDPDNCEAGATADIGDDDTATVTMTSDEKEQFRFTAATFTGSESSGTAVVTIEPVDAISGTAVTIEYASADGSADSPDDYTAVMAQLTWQDGESDARDVTITVNEDNEAEGDEDFTVTLTAITTETTEVTDPSTATVTIQDLPGVRIVDQDYVSDGESGSIVVTVERFGSFPEGGAQVDIASLESDPQSAESGVDFVAVVRQVTWNDESDPLQMTASFPLVTDDDVEGDETFEVQLQNAVQLEIREPSTDTLTITDDDFAFVLSAASYDTSETHGTLTITVERIGVSAGAGSIDYATADGTGDDAAVAGEDYTAASGTLNWADGDTDPKTFTVTITNDDAVENVENFTVALSNGQPDASEDEDQTPRMATVNLADNDASVEFTAATFASDEDAGNAVITLTRSGDLSADASADVTLTAGTATADDDYIDETLTAMWAAGEAEATVEVRVNADAEHEDDETLTLTLGNPGTTGPGTVNIGDQNTAELTITNDDDPVPGTLQFSAVDYSELESNGTITVTVTREGGDDTAIEVDYATSDGSATAGEDYTAASGTLMWADDDAEPKTFTITITDDGLVEGDETINLALSNDDSPELVGEPSTATATIVDEESAVQFTMAAQSANEDDGDITVTVERVGATLGAVTVDYASADGTATTADNDYTAVSGTLSWADGESGTRTFTVTLNADEEFEDDETFTVSLSNPSNDTSGATTILGDPDTQTVTISNDDESVVGTLQFSAVDYSELESNGTITVTVTREGGDDTAIEVDYATSDGSATAGEDYTAASGTLMWADDDAEPKTFTITITDDGLVEGDETINLALSNDDSPELVGEPSTATATIVDEESAVQFTMAAQSANEDDGDITVTVERVGATLGAVTVDYASADGTATTADNDYTAVSGTLSWADGESGTRTFTVTPTADEEDEDNETFTVSLSNPTNDTDGAATILGSPDTQTVTINDDDDPIFGSLQFSAVDYSELESNGTITVTVTREGGDDRAVSVDYATSDGSATAGEDYTGTSGTLSWANDDGEDKTFTITLGDDADVEGDETINLTLSNAQGGATLGEPDTATATIVDEESQVQFTVTAQSANEDDGDITVTVERVGATLGAVTVDYASADGTATTADNDYTAVMGTLSWADGESGSRTFTVTPTADMEFEDDETFALNLSNVTNDTAGATTTLGDNDTQTVTIVNDDASIEGSLQFSAVDYSELESNGTITVTVTRENGDDGAVSVEYATSDGTATAGEDYTAASGTLSWADDDAGDKTFTVTIANDAVLEGDETINLTLSNPMGDATLGDPSTATATIANDDYALEFVMSPVIASETDGQGTLTVTRLGYQDDTVTVDFATSDGTAEAGQDYTAASGTLTFAAGDASDQTITVTIANDDIAESNESFAVSLSSAAPSANFDSAASTLGGQINITDNEAVLRLDATTYAVSEDGGSVTVLVVRDGSTEGGVSVTLSTADDTAMAGEDYTATSMVVSFADGEGGSMPVQVPIIDDNEAEDDETFTVALSAPGQTGPGTATIGSPDTGTVTITNDDASVQGTLQFTAATFSAAEADGVIVVTVERVNGDDDPVSVEYATSDGSAVAGEDYTAASGTLNWADDDAEPKSFMVTVNDDAMFEDDEAFTLTLSNATGNATIGDPGTASGNIVNDDTALRLSSDMYSADEGELRVTITVQRLGDASGSVSVNYATTDGTATSPEHYTQTMGTLNWADGDNMPKTFDVPLVDNAETNDDRTFAVSLSGPTPDTRTTVVDPAQATVTITDDEDRLNFSAEAVSVSEGAGSVTVRVVRGGSGNGAVSVDVSTTDESATAGADYTATTQTLSWDDGELGAMEVTIPITDDNRAEGAETFMASLSNVMGNIVIAEPDTVTVTINDNDQAGIVVTETGSGTQIAEGGDGDTVLLSLATQPTGSVTVTIDPPDRVNVNPTTLVFTAQNWNQPRTVSLSINDDQQSQANRTVSGSLSASSATDAAYDGLSETVTIVITDAGAVQVISGDSGSLGLPLLALLGIAAAWQRRRRIVLR